jgi:sulfite exporter TauE/SafE
MHEILCGSPEVLAGGLFLTALLGSFAHCVPMCGPFVLMQSGGSAGKLLPRYQAGRLVTYIALGALAGGAGGWIAGQSALRWPLAVLLGVAALAFLAQAAARLFSLGGEALAFLSRPLARLVVPLAARQPGGFKLGLLLGLLPCGFLYAALAASAATGSALGGAMAMASFGIGTVPALVMVSLVGRAALSRWRALATPALTGLLLLNALSLSAAALHLVIV